MPLLSRLRWRLARLTQPKVRDLEQQLATMEKVVDLATGGRASYTTYDFGTYRELITEEFAAEFERGYREGFSEGGDASPTSIHEASLFAKTDHYGGGA